MFSKKRIAIIGAGASGLTAIKACKEEENEFSEIVCYEKTSCVGGLWKYRENTDLPIDSHERITTVAFTTVANSSKKMSAFSDFPPDEMTPNYMHHRVMLNYLHSYAKNFDLLRHIKCGYETLKVERVGCKWKITVRDNNSKETNVQDEWYDFVMICTGHHTHPYAPTFIGERKFKGEIVHSSNYKKAHDYYGKKALVVGVGNSGLDIAAELSSVSDKVYLSTRNGCWILPRLGFRGGRPYDTTLLRRSLHVFKDVFPATVVSFVIETMLNKRYDHELLQLRPSHPLFYEHPTVNDSVVPKIVCGSVVVKGDIDRLTPEGVQFLDESDVNEVDLVVLATGYQIDYPFLSDDLRASIVQKGDNSVNLYKYVFPLIDCDHEYCRDFKKVKIADDNETIDKNYNDTKTCTETLGFIGVPNALGPLFPIAEIQSRWFVQVAVGKCSLPTLVDMKNDIKQQEKRKSEKFTTSFRHGVQVEWSPYIDEIAKQFDAMPNFRQLITEDFRLLLKLIFGPSLPYQYRLQGPHRWSEARNAIMSVKERIEAPFKTSKRVAVVGKDRVSLNIPYRQNGLLYQIFFGAIVVLFMDLMFRYSH